MIKIITISKTKRQNVEFSQVVIIDGEKRTSETKHLPSHIVEKLRRITEKQNKK